MTNEKAIMCLEDMKIKVPIPKAAKQARENNEALDVAIKALQSAQPKTNYSESPNTSDCISRQAAIDALGEIATFTEDWSCHTWMYTDDVYNAIKQLPTIQPDNNSENPNSSDVISRQKAIDALRTMQTYKLFAGDDMLLIDQAGAQTELMLLPPIQPEIVRCKDCKHNPKYEWFGCPMSHLSEKQRPETAWCWKAERRTDE